MFKRKLLKFLAVFFGSPVPIKLGSIPNSLKTFAVPLPITPILFIVAKGMGKISDQNADFILPLFFANAVVLLHR